MPIEFNLTVVIIFSPFLNFIRTIKFHQMKSKLILFLILFLTFHLQLVACTIFSFEVDENVFVGNNEDWYIPHTKYRIIEGKEKEYGRIVFSYSNNWGQGGMNEKGLFFDWLLISEEPNNWKRDSLKKDVNGNLSERILAECATVEEALKYYERYNESGFKTSMIVLVDTSGQTAFVSWENGKIKVESCKGSCIGGYGGNKVVAKYKEIEGKITKDKMKILLDVAHQEGDYPTLYSNIYDLKRKTICLYNFHDYEEEVKINLEEALRKGNHSVEISNLFKNQMPRNKFRELQKRYIIEELQTIPIKGWIMVFSIFIAFLFILKITYNLGKIFFRTKEVGI